MGIQNFHQWIHETYPEIFISPYKCTVYEYIYIDINYILHNSIYNCQNIYDFRKKLIIGLNVIFSSFIATKGIYLNFDGPSSYAKVILQRKRRNKLNGGCGNPSKGQELSLGLTPGTTFIGEIEKCMDIYARNLKNSYSHISPKIHISNSKEPNEGEIKISQHILKNGLNDLKDRHLIIGNDSDLIVISMALKPIYNINILIKIKNSNELVSIKKLIEGHVEKVVDDYTRPKKPKNIYNSPCRDDFVLISLLMGNDYFPKINYLKHDKLWDVYYSFAKGIWGTIIKDGLFNSDTAQNFFYVLYNKLPGRYKTNDIKLYNEKKSQTYLEGLLWCLNMYSTGKCSKFNYMYNYAPPHPYELLIHICSSNIVQIPHSSIQPIPYYAYPLITLPKKAKNLIHPKYHHLMTSDLKYLYEIEDCTLCQQIHCDLSIIGRKMNDKSISEKEYEKLKKDNRNKINEYDVHKMCHNLKFDEKDIINIINIIHKHHPIGNGKIKK